MSTDSLPHQTVFIVSTGRTATKALAHYLHEAWPGVTATHEPWPSRPLRVAANMYRSRKISKKTMTMTLRYARPSLRHSHAGVHIEASPYLRSCIELLGEAFGDIRVIHLTRHPETYVRSYINHGVFSGAKGLAGKWIPYWHIKPEHIDSDSGLRWRTMNSAERIAWRWNALNSMLDAAADVYGERYLRIRYEDLFDENSHGLELISRWIGLEWTEELKRRTSTPLNQSLRQRTPQDDAWSDELQRAVRQFCGDRMARYGYSLLDQG
ncbi:sulfotransferase [Ectothiorhodospiraceae bacterium WFHF3C12]|nr:sulfotransferase [Ectothiorhodospiraceae bacterium WFHF3C12]